MKNKTLKPPLCRWKSLPGCCAGLLVVLGTLLVAPSRLWAQATVTTLGGGALNLPYAGDVNGNTLTTAMFNGPQGMALDPSGTFLFIADYNNNAVRLVSQVGNTAASTTTTFANATTSGTTAINHPVAVIVDGATNVYVLNHGTGVNGAVLHLGGAGLASGVVIVYPPLATGLANPTAMTMDALENLYVTTGSKVLRVATNGTLTTLGTVTNASLQGVVLLDSGMLALTDSANNGIWIMNPANGSYSRFTGFNGAGDALGSSSVAAFNNLTGITKAGGGILVVADNGNDKVKLVDNSGNVSLLYGVSSSLWPPYDPSLGLWPGWLDGPAGAASDDAESRLPTGVLVGLDGSVYVTEDYYHVLRHVTGAGLSAPSLSYPQTPEIFNGLAGIAYDGIDNYLFIANSAKNAVQLLNLNNNVSLNYLNSLDGVTNPAAVLVDPSDNLYVLNRSAAGNGYVLEFDPYGNAFGPIITNLNQPTAFTLDGYGNLFVAEQTGNIRAFGPTVPTNMVATVTNAHVSLQGIALFSDGTLAVSDAGNQVIWDVNPLTKLITKLTGQLGTNGAAVGASNFAKLNQPHQLCRVGGNQLVAADYGNNRLVLVSRAGTVLTNYPGNVPIFSYVTNGTLWFGNSFDPVISTNSRFVSISQPFGVTVDGSGNIFDSELGTNVVRRITGTALSAPAAPPDVPLPAYSGPAGIVLDNENSALFVAMTANNAVDVLDLADNATSVFLNSSNALSHPVDVAVDGSDDLYVLNRAGGTNGFILEFDLFGNLLATNAVNLNLPAAMTLDSSGNMLVAESGGTILSIAAGSNTVSTVATVTNAGVQLAGIALFSDGTIVVSDAGKQVLWQINPVTKVVSLFTGQLGSPGTTLGSTSFAKFNQPHQLKLAAGNLLVTADTGNNRLVVVNRSGSVTNVLISTNADIWFGLPNDPITSSSPDFVPMVSPFGVAVGTGGGVFASETYYDDIRELLDTGLSQLSSGGGSTGTGTNLVVIAPTITPDSGYYPMGQTLLVQSPAPQVFYTTDGSNPTTNSSSVTISDNVGYIPWFNSTNDLTKLRAISVAGLTNASAVVSGVSVSAADIGVPSDYNPELYAGIGSSIVVPVVCNLAPGQQIESYQFLVEIAPLNNPNTPVISPLSIIPTNDFVPLVTAAQTGFVATNTIVPFSLGITNGLEIFAVGSGTHILFQNYAVVALLEVQIPYFASQGDTYAISVVIPSATADAYNTPVMLTPMPPMTIVVTNLPYLVGDSASPLGDWYNAGTFGDGNLDNPDVNQVFDAASGLRVPYSFTDVYNAMDAYPPDSAGFVGGDGELRFLDWYTVLQRSLGLDPDNWDREWSADGLLIDFSTNLVSHALTEPVTKLTKNLSEINTNAPWYRQVLLGAASVSDAAANSTVYVPVYAQLADGASLSGLQFRAVVTPQGEAPPLTMAPELDLASGVPSPLLTQSFKAGETAFGWTLGSFDFASRSSNLVGWVTFTVPTNALTGQMYQVSLLNADGAPNPTNEYNFETRSATVAVNTSAPPATICSDEWKVHFFGSTTNPAAADNADPDGDGVPNWMEFLAGTDPTNPQSKLQLAGNLAKTSGPMELSWLTAPGRAYAVQWNNNLAGGAWQTLGSVSGNGYTTNCADLTLTNSTRYYRLSVLP